MINYSVLSLDGGGVRGIITARLLSWVEKRLQEKSANSEARLADYFDFFVGTSAGGILISSYLYPNDDGTRPRYSAQEVEDTYTKLAVESFEQNLVEKVTRRHGITSSKYSPEPIEKILSSYFEDLKLSQLVRPCVITSYDMKTNQPLLFRRQGAVLSERDDFYVRDVCRATTAAPTYFPPYGITSLAGEKEYLSIDGGIYGNNPAMIGYSELRRLDPKASASKMKLLSIGTGKHLHLHKFEEKEVQGWGMLDWYQPLTTLMTVCNMANVEFQLEMVFRDAPGNYLRVNPKLDDPKLAKMDLTTDESKQSLINLTDNYIKIHEQKLEDFVENIYNRRQDRPIDSADEILDLHVDKVWLQEYPATVPETIDPDKYDNINHMIDEAAKLHHDKIAYEQFGHKVTYSEVYQQSDNLAAYLQDAHKIGKGSVVAIMMPNCLQYPISIFAILKLGASVLNLNPLYTAEEVAKVLASIKPDVLVIWNGCSFRVERAIAQADESLGAAAKTPHVIITGLGDLVTGLKGPIINTVLRLKKRVEKSSLRGSSFKSVLNAGSKLSVFRPAVKGEDLAFLQLTGGTTGTPKAAMLTHRNMVANVMQARVYLDERFTQQDGRQRIGLTALPLYHIFSLMVNGMTFFHLGIYNVLIANPRDIPSLMKDIHKHKYDCIDGVNTLFKAMLANPEFAKADFSNLTLTLGGGMAVQSEVADDWQKVTGCLLNQGYGLTEASPVVSFNPYTAKKYNKSIGLPVPSTEVAILDANKRVLPYGKEGALYVRGPQVMQGYYNNPEATRADLSLDNWLNTGDIAYMDEKGYIYIVDRAKDIIIVSGFNVYPNEVEEVVDSYDKVFESACIGVPSERSGEAVKVFVVLQPGAMATEQEIKDYAATKLTGYKTPDVVEFVESLPKTNVGKILRRALKEDPPAAAAAAAKPAAKQPTAAESKAKNQAAK